MFEIIGAIVTFVLIIVLIISSWFSSHDSETNDDKNEHIYTFDMEKSSLINTKTRKNKKNRNVVFSEVSNKRFIDKRGNINDQAVKTRAPAD